MRNFKWTILIVLIFIAFLGYYQFVQRGTEVEGFQSLLGELEGKKLDKVSLKSDEGETKVILENDEWYVVGKGKYIADQELVEEMIYKLERLESLETIKQDAEDLEMYGLEKPRYKLFLYVGDIMQEVHVGNFTPSKDCYFAKLPERNTVFKIGKSRMNEITKSSDELRAKQIFAGKSEDITQIEIIRRGEHLLTFSKDNDVWRINEVTSYELEEEKVNNFIADLKKIIISEYTDDKNIKMSFYGLDNPSIIVTITYNDGHEAKLILGSSAGLGEVYGKRGGSEAVFTVPYKSVEFFGKITVGQ